MDHRRECSSIQIPIAKRGVTPSLFLLHKSQLHLEYRTDGSAAQAQLARTLSSLVRIETELLNRARAQAAAAAVGAGAEGEGERGGGGDV